MVQQALITPVFRSSFVHVFQPSQNQSGKMQYSIVMIFDPASIQADEKEKSLWVSIQQAIHQATMEKFPNGTPAKFKATPFRKGVPEEYDLEKYPEYKGMIIASATSQNMKPDVLDARNGQPILDPALMYSGCFCRASIVPFIYDGKTKDGVSHGNRGVSFGLRNVLKVADGDPLISKSKAEDDFAQFMQADASVGLSNSGSLFDL